MESAKVRVAHVQLLAAGKGRVFEPWVSLVQMASAYGQWFRERKGDPDDAVRVNVYVVDPGVIALLQGGYIDLSYKLEDTALRIEVETIDAATHARHHHIAEADAKVGDLVGRLQPGTRPRIYAQPRPTTELEPEALEGAMKRSLREFGLVWGSTLVIDYRIPPK